ncbi:MAG: hypothetical protein WKF71_01810 [Pyrinomonadaceae bacterium]
MSDPGTSHDDYWNPSTIREMWRDLPQGKPEARAAKLEGYNGGKDEFGRTVMLSQRNRYCRRNVLV